jgi:hypothetical protein
MRAPITLLLLLAGTNRDGGGCVHDFEGDPDGDGHVGELDCVQNDGDIHPGAPDPVDGIDSNCDGVDGEDGDRDGVASVTSGGEDCDDADDATYPGAPEVCGDGVVNDCAAIGTTAARETCRQVLTLDEACVVVEAEEGYAISSAQLGGDLDGDGWTDLALSTYLYDSSNPNYTDDVRVDILLGPLDGRSRVSESDWRQTRPERTLPAWYGAPLVFTDDIVGPNGRPELVVAGYDKTHGSSTTATVALIEWPDGGPVTWEESLDNAAATLTAGEHQGNFGASLFSPGDLNGDGQVDLVVGQNFTEDNWHDGRVHVFYGPLQPGLTEGVQFVGQVWRDQQKATNFGDRTVSIAPDMDGDGLPELFLGMDAFDDPEGLEVGAGFIVSGATAGDFFVEEQALASIIGAQDVSRTCRHPTVIHDMDGDGHAELICSAPFGDTGDGVVYLWYGPLAPGEHNVTSADLNIVSTGAQHHLGVQIQEGNDVNGDGLGDLVFSAGTVDDLGVDIDSYVVFLGDHTRRQPGTLDVTQADITILGDPVRPVSTRGFVGRFAQDMDADGDTELLVHTYNTSTNRGELYIFCGAPHY